MEYSIPAVLDELKKLGLVKSAEHFTEIDSTNSAARLYANTPQAVFPALLVADRQTSGRGRGDHRWWSPQGCLMLTLIVRSDQLPESRDDWSQLALVVGVSAARAVEAVCPGLTAQLKWPNDIYLQGRKAGGVLIETFSPRQSNQMLQCFAIGIGLNTCMDWQSAPDEVRSKAICLSRASEREVAREMLLFELVEQLMQGVRQWRADCSSWIDDWQQRCLLNGRFVSIRGLGQHTSVISGLCEGVGSDGQLLVRNANGVLMAINAGEVLD